MKKSILILVAITASFNALTSTLMAQNISNATKCNDFSVLVNDPDKNGTNIRNIPSSLPNSKVVGIFPYNQTADNFEQSFSEVILKGQYSKNESWFNVETNIAKFDRNGFVISEKKIVGYMASRYKNGTPILITYLKGYSDADLNIYQDSTGSKSIGKIEQGVEGPEITVLGCEGNRIKSSIPDVVSGKNIIGWIERSATCPNSVTNCN